ncbi:MAG: hypothetical protein GXP15_10185 [Gammaproteobacteria bacterium]|nr:hypothetical protein [Gammaproteobacteria bacterium]
MSIKLSQSDSPVAGLKNEASRQRWELFHRAIAHAKQSNSDAMQQTSNGDGEPKRRRPVLTIAK